MRESLACKTRSQLAAAAQSRSSSWYRFQTQVREISVDHRLLLPRSEGSGVQTTRKLMPGFGKSEVCVMRHDTYCDQNYCSLHF